MARDTPSPADYGRHIDAGQLIGGRCGACGYAVAPATPRCPSCGGVMRQAERFSVAGRVWSATVLHIPAAGRRPPVGFAYVDLHDGPRVLALFEGDRPLPVGAAVRLRQTGSELLAEIDEETT